MNPQPSIPTDDQWSLLQPLFPPPSPFLRGRPPLDDRLILAAILYKTCHDLPWYDLPPDFPSHQTVYRRYRQWLRLGLWDPILRTLSVDLHERGEFSTLQALVDKIYQVNFDRNRWTVTLAPAAPQTWQVLTGWIFAWMLILETHRLYTASRRARFKIYRV